MYAYALATTALSTMLSCAGHYASELEILSILTMAALQAICGKLFKIKDTQKQSVCFDFMEIGR